MKRQIFVISDLHLGGDPNAVQSCNSYEELAEFIQGLAHESLDGVEDRELVLNGDILDFLAPDKFEWSDKKGEVHEATPRIWTRNDEEAVARFDRIVELTQPVFDALSAFLDAGYLLTFLIGNHDVELCLSPVRKRLSEILGARGKRFNFVYDGEAYSVGKLLIEHGNNYDSWNQIDHSSLHHERSYRSRGLPIDTAKRDHYFTPPPGTFLVIYLNNILKKDYPFVDLLKPEVAAAVPLLLFLDPINRDLVKILLWLVPGIGMTLSGEELPPEMQVTKPNSESAPQGAEAIEEGLEDPLGVVEPSKIGEEGEEGKVEEEGEEGEEGKVEEEGKDVETIKEVDEFEQLDLIIQAARNNENIEEPPLVAPTKVKTEVVSTPYWLVGGMMSWIASIPTFFSWFLTRNSAWDLYGLWMARNSKNRIRLLHKALQSLNKSDRSYDYTRSEDIYSKAAFKLMELGDYEVVVFGHTHIPKRVEKQSEDGDTQIYLNTGSWTDLLFIPEELLASKGEKDKTRRNDKTRKNELKELYQFAADLKDGNFTPYVKRFLSYAVIIVNLDSGAVEDSQLHSYCGPENPRAEPLKEYRKS
jgi:UDP-2,3-diacylglucosamine pyrophosphatase LpxH